MKSRNKTTTPNTRLGLGLEGRYPVLNVRCKTDERWGVHVLRTVRDINVLVVLMCTIPHATSKKKQVGPHITHSSQMLSRGVRGIESGI
jgi:hypothetical protein